MGPWLRLPEMTGTRGLIASASGMILIDEATQTLERVQLYFKAGRRSYVWRPVNGFG